MLHGHLLAMYTFSCGCVLNVALVKSCIGLICTLYPTEPILQRQLELIYLIPHEHSSYLVITTSQVQQLSSANVRYAWQSIWQASKLEQLKPIKFYFTKEALYDNNQKQFLLENKQGSTLVHSQISLLLTLILSFISHCVITKISYSSWVIIIT